MKLFRHLAAFSFILPLSVFAETTTPTVPQATTVPSNITCDSHFSKDTQPIPPATVEAWANQAAASSFTFDHASIDNQLEQLKACYTDQGWKGFNDAMHQSGNLEAIKTNQLNVSSQVQGKATVILLKENEWKVSVPLNVVYANKEQKVAQLLSIDLLVHRKPSGDLGIVQLIATPTKTDNPKP